MKTQLIPHKNTIDDLINGVIFAAILILIMLLPKFCFKVSTNEYEQLKIYRENQADIKKQNLDKKSKQD